MSLQEITNRIRSVEARIVEIERRISAFQAGDGLAAGETPFAKALEAERRKAAAPPAAPAVNAKPEPAAPPADEAPILVPPAIPAPSEMRARTPGDFLSPRLVAEREEPPAPAIEKPAAERSARRVPPDVLPTLVEAAKRYRIDPALVAAVIDAESGWDRRAVSPKGALGLMQLMPGTAEDMGVEDPFDPEENIYGGVRYLRKLLDRFPTKEQAIAAYNAGPERVERAGGVPDIRETREYVERVLSRYALRRNGDLGEEKTE